MRKVSIGTMRGLRALIMGIAIGLSAAAISNELEKPPTQRTWKGRIAGVPYNFRIWEWRAVAQEYWNPASDQILAPHAIGLGWGVNFAALGRRAQDLLAVPAAER